MWTGSWVSSSFDRKAQRPVKSRSGYCLDATQKAARGAIAEPIKWTDPGQYCVKTQKALQDHSSNVPVTFSYS